MLDRDPNRFLKDDGVAQMPAVGARMAAHDPPLIEIGCSEIGRLRCFESPSGKEIVFRSRSPNLRLVLSVDIYFFVALAKPRRAPAAHG